jgi:hypothetical protein
MPDKWEEAHGLDKMKDDSAQPMPSGYTGIEDYLNELVAKLLKQPGTPRMGNEQ